jgi:cell division septum initiation protein DivIVA
VRSEHGVDHVELPRAKFGGLKEGPVDDLLRRIARDYASLEHENRKLWEKVERLEPRLPGAGDRREHAPSPGEEHSGPREPTASEASALLALAHRVAGEMRESARNECELMIRKTRSHAQRLERDLARERTAAVADLEALRAVRRELRDTMQASLQSLLRTFRAERTRESLELEWEAEALAFASAVERSTEVEKDEIETLRGSTARHRR